MRTKKISAVMCMVFVLVVLFCVPVYASGDVAGANRLKQLSIMLYFPL